MSIIFHYQQNWFLVYVSAENFQLATYHFHVRRSEHLPVQSAHENYISWWQFSLWAFTVVLFCNYCTYYQYYTLCDTQCTSEQKVYDCGRVCLHNYLSALLYASAFICIGLRAWVQHVHAHVVYGYNFLVIHFTDGMNNSLTLCALPEKGHQCKTLLASSALPKECHQAIKSIAIILWILIIFHFLLLLRAMAFIKGCNICFHTQQCLMLNIHIQKYCA